jgi:phage recombination protein Bet
MDIEKRETLDLSSLSQDKIELIKRTVAQGATDDELQLYLHTCKRMNVHPLDKLLHFTKYNSKNGARVSFITSIDFYRMKAYETGLVDGIQVQPIYDDRGALYSAKARVYRKDMKYPVEAEALWSEYGSSKSMWTKMPVLMLKKCAEALALRMAFPDALHGVYTAEEMAQAENNWYQEPPNISPPKSIDYAIIPVGQHKGERWEDVDDDTLKKAHDAFSTGALREHKNRVEYLSAISDVLSSRNYTLASVDDKNGNSGEGWIKKEEHKTEITSAPKDAVLDVDEGDGYDLGYDDETPLDKPESDETGFFEEEK